MRQRAFTLIELLTVIGIISVLTAIALPAGSAVRKQAWKCLCASNLRQVGNSILLYTQDHRGRLPDVIEPMWTTLPTQGKIDMSIDPRTDPRSFLSVMKPYGVTPDLLTCPAAVMQVINDPSQEPIQTYRISSSNNADGIPKRIEQFYLPGGDIDYFYSLKYLNGRKYDVDHVMLRSVSGVMRGVKFRGAGPFYLARDFVKAQTKGWITTYTPPHNKQFNQLKLDMTVSLEKDLTPISASP